ncbi:hypothetical protein O181_020261 [Austropuccinia psidii MF-1]|uniref:Uncharacterized protein n=1 Tax=Austropuccinia psidii MF-1 TaxID=1389203 RepID=A0A9Q3CD49_9BASI|nr:hypothetical protein [Austropuccinia psidii MF-1]
MGFKFQSNFSFSSLIHFLSGNHTRFLSLPIEPNPQNPSQQDTPFPCIYCEQTLWQPTPGPKPSHPNKPPIPSPSQSCKPHEEIPTCEPEPEEAPKQSSEAPFACPATPHLVIIIDNMPVGSPTPPPFLEIPPIASKNTTPCSPHSHNEVCQEFTDLQPTLMIP